MYRYMFTEMEMMVLLSLLLLPLAAAGDQDASSSPSSPPQPSSLALPNCPDKCGNVTIPYPFGTREGCYRQDSSCNQTFLMTCNDTFQPPKLFIGTGNIQVLSIASLEKVVVGNIAARVCYKNTSVTEFAEYAWTTLPQRSPYVFSETQNRFTVLGCNTLAQITTNDFARSCASHCSHTEMMNMQVNGSSSSSSSSCSSGIGCCQATIPKGLENYSLLVPTLQATNDSDTPSFAPCSFSFLVDKDYSLPFSAANDLRDPNFADKARAFPLVLDWAVGTQPCEEARKDPAIFACRGNSTCTDSTNGPGYRCSCLQGFDGNPYLPQGCQDINECEDQAKYPCRSVGSICINSVGNYSCHCPHGTYDDGTRCVEQKSFPIIKVAVGGGLSLILEVVAVSLFCWMVKQRRLLNIRDKFFKQNGGLLLQEYLGGLQGALERGKIFTARELEKATKNYEESRVIGRGGSGMVYKGNLSDDRAVAIKKSKTVDENQMEQFINEVFILSQINHRNVVKLLGCCLETQVPLLVYEYVTNGTLFYHIHGNAHVSSLLSWNHRLRIASETAAALAYLHSAASIPIIHRDVKSANILLDDNYTAKVADFGASRLIPKDKAHVTTLVLGTSGYLDPEYLLTSQLTEKSDVYSFGVVLVELLTGKKPIFFDTFEKAERNLSNYFILSMEGNHLLEIVDAQLVSDGVSTVQLTVVAELAKRCLSVKGDERPAMKEVAAELDGLTRALVAAVDSNSIER